MRENNTTKHTVRNDIIFITVLLLIAAITMLYLFVIRSQGDIVKVTVDSEIYGIYPLSYDITEDIYSGENKEHMNRLVIHNGKAYIEEATCPDGICVSHSPIFRDGESIVCLPQRVVITVISTEDDDNPDVIL